MCGTFDVPGPQDGSAHALQQRYVCPAVTLVRIPAAAGPVPRVLTEPDEVDHDDRPGVGQ